ncbi:arsenate reductase ArsC [bacterium]|nr:arsenate reductase ArsC [bacterium]
MYEHAKPSVLFLCTGNSCRSQMAEGWLRHVAADRFEALSAGLEPREIDPLAIAVMAEVGVDIRGQRSKSVSEYLGRRTVTHAVFVCDAAERNCPRIYPFALHRLSWPFADPAACAGTEEERRARFRAVRDEIGARIRAWLDELGVEGA